MQSVITNILTDNEARGAKVVESQLINQAEIAAPWADVAE
jgi:hypothetical protein